MINFFVWKKILILLFCSLFIGAEKLVSSIVIFPYLFLALIKRKKFLLMIISIWLWVYSDFQIEQLNSRLKNDQWESIKTFLSLYFPLLFYPLSLLIFPKVAQNDIFVHLQFLLFLWANVWSIEFCQNLSPFLIKYFLNEAFLVFLFSSHTSEAFLFSKIPT